MVRAAARLALVHEALPVCVEALVEHVVGHIITQYERTASPAPSHPCSSPTLAHALVPTLCDCTPTAAPLFTRVALVCARARPRYLLPPRSWLTISGRFLANSAEPRKPSGSSLSGSYEQLMMAYEMPASAGPKVKSDARYTTEVGTSRGGSRILFAQ